MSKRLIETQALLKKYKTPKTKVVMNYYFTKQLLYINKTFGIVLYKPIMEYNNNCDNDLVELADKSFSAKYKREIITYRVSKLKEEMIGKQKIDVLDYKVKTYDLRKIITLLEYKNNDEIKLEVSKGTEKWGRLFIRNDNGVVHLVVWDK